MNVGDKPMRLVAYIAALTLCMCGNPSYALLKGVAGGGSSGGPTTNPVSVAQGGSGTGTAFTQGSVVFAGNAGTYAQNNTAFFWDNSALALTITGTNQTPLSLSSSNLAGTGVYLQNSGGHNILVQSVGSGSGTNGLQFYDSNSFASMFFQPSSGTIIIPPGGQFAFSNVANTAPAPTDVGMGRDSAGIFKVTNGAAGSGAIKSDAIISGGTKFTTSGCSVSATTGGGTAGIYTSGTAGTCTTVITMNGATGRTAPNGWACSASDRTTPADIITQTASTTTTATLSGTTASGDVISFYCMGY